MFQTTIFIKKEALLTKVSAEIIKFAFKSTTIEMKDLNRIKVVLVEKGGAAKLPSVLWRVPENQQVVGRAVRQERLDCQQMVYQYGTTRPPYFG